MRENEFVNKSTGFIALGKITWTEDGKDEERKLSNGVAFRSITPYREFKELASYEDTEINEELLTVKASIDSADFDIASTI